MPDAPSDAATRSRCEFEHGEQVRGAPGGPAVDHRLLAAGGGVEQDEQGGAKQRRRDAALRARDEVGGADGEPVAAAHELGVAHLEAGGERQRAVSGQLQAVGQPGQRGDLGRADEAGDAGRGRGVAVEQVAAVGTERGDEIGAGRAEREVVRAAGAAHGHHAEGKVGAAAVGAAGARGGVDEGVVGGLVVEPDRMGRAGGDGHGDGGDGGVAGRKVEHADGLRGRRREAHGAAGREIAAGDGDGDGVGDDAGAKSVGVDLGRDGLQVARGGVVGVEGTAARARGVHEHGEVTPGKELGGEVRDGAAGDRDGAHGRPGAPDLQAIGRGLGATDGRRGLDVGHDTAVGTGVEQVPLGGAGGHEHAALAGGGIPGLDCAGGIGVDHPGQGRQRGDGRARGREEGRDEPDAHGDQREGQKAQPAEQDGARAAAAHDEPGRGDARRLRPHQQAPVRP